MSQLSIDTTSSSKRRSTAKFVEPLRRRQIRIPELAVGLLVIAAAVTVSVVLNTDDSEGTGVLAVNRSVPRGHVIDSSNLTVVTLTADQNVALLSTRLAEDVIGMRAAVDIDAGTPLSSSHLFDMVPLSSADAVVGIVIDDSVAPADLVVGDTVRVVFLDSSLERGDVVTTLPTLAEVWSVSSPDGLSSDRSISLRVPRLVADSFVGHDEIHLVKVVS
ncbi:MAG: SAF domain-containing protein [Actinomycetota bacterium]|nr:SAF domain-containing protein [Actinomycetota bacterium]MDA2971645.1 SAF domain-containing protein [Actinomycetota bacterium]MDA3000231.1 SAF domain-containing protein [Actinomycetota bacterium]